MNVILIMIALSIVLFLNPQVFGEPVIISEGIEYEIAEITKEYKLSKYSHITKSQGFTTTGEMFFLRVSDVTDFQKVMLLDREGHWLKAEIKDKIIEEIEQETPVNEILEVENIEILMTGKYSMVTALKDTIILDFRFYDSKLNPNQDDTLNYGTINGADVSISIINPTKQNQVEWSIIGKTDSSGNFEDEFRVETNNELMAEYIINILVEYQDNFLKKSLPLFIEEYNADQIFGDVLKLN